VERTHAIAEIAIAVKIEIEIEVNGSETVVNAIEVLPDARSIIDHIEKDLAVIDPEIGALLAP